MELLNVTQDVEKLLRKSKECRESDCRLVVSIWAHHLGANVDKMSAVDLLNKISENRMPNFESIRRVRQKLQEKFPDLRGENYKQRKSEETKIKEQIKQI